jgi:hypothetical protein
MREDRAPRPRPIARWRIRRELRKQRKLSRLPRRSLLTLLFPSRAWNGPSMPRRPSLRERLEARRRRAEAQLPRPRFSLFQNRQDRVLAVLAALVVGGGILAFVMLGGDGTRPAARTALPRVTPTTPAATEAAVPAPTASETATKAPKKSPKASKAPAPKKSTQPATTQAPPPPAATQPPPPPPPPPATTNPPPSPTPKPTFSPSPTP